MAASAHDIDLLVSCDGDDVFCDPFHVDEVIRTHRRTGAEYITCTGLPFGTAPTGVARTGLERVCARKRETDTEGQGRFFAAPGIVTRAEVAAPDDVRHAESRMTLDYPEDLEFLRQCWTSSRPTRARRYRGSSRCSGSVRTSWRSMPAARPSTGNGFIARYGPVVLEA